MDAKEIIETIKSIYKEHEDLEEMVTDLSDNSYIDHWANKFCEEDYGQNRELAKKLFELHEKSCESSNDFCDLACKVSSEDTLNNKVWAKKLFEKAIDLAEDNITDLQSIADSIAYSSYLNDKVWAKTLYEKVAENLNELSDYNNLSNSINRHLEDKNWANNLIQQAKENLINSDDKFEFAGYSREMLTLAENIADEDHTDDKEGAKEIFELLKDYEGVSDLLDAARKVKEIYEDENEYIEEYMNECLDNAIDYIDAGYYCDIYYFIKDDIEDAQRAEEFREANEDEMRNDYEEYGSCEELFGDNKSDIDLDDVDFDNLYDKRNIVAFTTNNFVFSKIEDMFDDNGNLSEDAIELANESLGEFIDAVKEKFENNIEDTMYVQVDGKLREYKNDLDNNVEDFEQITLYMVFTKEVPSEIINALFLDIAEYGFYANFENDDEIILQGYDYGEYDTGYFSNNQDDGYINNFKWAWECYPEAQKLLY